MIQTVRLEHAYIAGIFGSAPIPRDAAKLVNGYIRHGIPTGDDPDEIELAAEVDVAPTLQTSPRVTAGFVAVVPDVPSSSTPWATEPPRAGTIAAVLAELPNPLTVRQVAHLAQKCEKTVRRWISAGWLESGRPVLAGSSPHLIEKASVEKFFRRIGLL